MKQIMRGGLDVRVLACGIAGYEDWGIGEVVLLHVER
jgi:hypothetical protein